MSGEEPPRGNSSSENPRMCTTYLDEELEEAQANSVGFRVGTA